MSNVTAIILAGGRGERMGMLCHDRPKPILPFAGKFRVVDFTLSNCINSQIDNIAVLTDYRRVDMMGYLKEWNEHNRDHSLHILEPADGSYNGTADAVYQNMCFLRKHGADITLVLAGDHIYKMDYRKLIDFHKGSGAEITIGIYPVSIEQAHRFGITRINGDGRITEFVEKPGFPESNLVSMGIYVFNTDILIRRLAEDAVKHDSRHDFGYDILPRVVREDRVYAYKYTDFWRDIGSIEAYHAANMMFTGSMSPFRLNGQWPIFTREYESMPPQVYGQGSVVNSVISTGCVVKGHVENSVVAPGCLIEEDVVIKNSVLMGNNHIERHSLIDVCIMDEYAGTEKFCFVGFGSSRLTESRGVTVVGKGAVIPSHTAVGRNCKITPYSKGNDFQLNLLPCYSVVS